MKHDKPVLVWEPGPVGPTLAPGCAIDDPPEAGHRHIARVVIAPETESVAE